MGPVKRARRGWLARSAARRLAQRKYWESQVMLLWERGYDETAAEIIRRGWVSR